ncbi:MAG: SusC/RagA family TonB-linked outer membrane protein [Bacteroidia bacterium]|nr:SusC/RagA family TonB-linked outer membrane protein [Bacteroidia bacterium]
MKKHINRLSILLCLFLVLPISAQKREKKGNVNQTQSSELDVTTQQSSKKVVKHAITGQVIDEKGNPISGVIITANEDSDQSTTDGEGKFSIEIKQGSTFLFELSGYQKVSMNETQLTSKLNRVVLLTEVISNIDGKVELPYQTLSHYKTTGLVSVIDPANELDRDSRYSLSTAINGKVPGLLGAKNIHGMGTAVVIVDGVKRDESYLNLQEIESITVLKDAVSRMLYGADGDQGVILVKTKSGESNKKIVNVNVEQGIQQALQYPKFLNAAQYMAAYNKAQQNDASFAGSPLVLPKYSQSMIDNTLNNVDPVLYPDNDYYSSEYVKNLTNYTNVFGELSGGNSNTQYYLNVSWKHSDGWTKVGNNDSQDIMNIHGKVGFKVTNWLKMNSEVVGIFDITNLPNVNTYNADGSVNLDYWDKASTYLPNTQSLLIPVSRISNPAIIPSSSLIDGQYILGGSGVYQTSLLGDMTRSGSNMIMNRYMQFNTGFDLSLDGITKGLTGKGLLSLNFNNTYQKTILNTYSVYQMGVVDSVGNFPVTQIGVDNKTSEQTNTQTYFDRTISAYMSLNYDRTFGKHAISAVLVGTFNQYTQAALFQENKNVKVGLQANYSFNDRYMLDAGLLCQGSSKLPTNNKFGLAPSVGLGWIVSKENFMKNMKAIDYLKLRASYGVIQNDSWTIGNYNGYLLYETNYSTSSSFTYGNGAASNTQVLINSFASNITWQTRKEFVAGFDASLFNKKTWLEASYFNSENGNIITQMDNNSPATLGGVPIFENYNTTVYQGVELGIKHSEKAGAFSLTIGANYMYSASNITKIDEPVYNLPTNINLEQVGTSSNAFWGLTSAGMYMSSDFDSNGQLLTTLPTPTYGTVRPGDIKYVDYNQDGKITANDRHVLGLSSNNQQYSFDLDLKYGNWQLYVLAIGQMGGKGFTNSNYYWFKGTSAKYSTVALGAFDPLNPDPNAAYPRLSLSNGTNNYINSTFWEYDKSNFTLSAVQIGYNFKFKQHSPITGLKIYGRGSNLLTFAKDLEIQKLNYQSNPQNRVFSLGLIASF